IARDRAHVDRLVIRVTEHVIRADDVARREDLALDVRDLHRSHDEPIDRPALRRAVLDDEREPSTRLREGPRLLRGACRVCALLEERPPPHEDVRDLAVRIDGYREALVRVIDAPIYL